MNQLKTPISNLILGGKRNEKGVYRSKTGHGGHVDPLDPPLNCRQPFISSWVGPSWPSILAFIPCDGTYAFSSRPYIIPN